MGWPEVDFEDTRREILRRDIRTQGTRMANSHLHIFLTRVSSVKKKTAFPECVLFDD